VWLQSHLSDPYPQENDKAILAAASGLTVRQVEAWFSRTRRRKLPPIEMTIFDRQDAVPIGDDVITSLTLASVAGVEPDRAACESLVEEREFPALVARQVIQVTGNDTVHCLRSPSGPHDALGGDVEHLRLLERSVRNSLDDNAASPDAMQSSLEVSPSTRQGSPVEERPWCPEIEPSDIYLRSAAL